MHCFGNKYGAEMDECTSLLATARALNLNVIGISFHVGSLASSPSAFPDAISTARSVFNLGLGLGFDMRILDLGGGYPGGKFSSEGAFNLAPTAAAINAALSQHFPPSIGVSVVAEPGRFFAEQPSAFICAINGLRTRTKPDGSQRQDYFLSDGTYGSFNCIFYDLAKPLATPLRNPLLPAVTAEQELQHFDTTLFGPTCDGADIIGRDLLLPQMRFGDFVFFPHLGAYSIAGACNFNGFDVAGAKMFYYCSQL